MGTSAARAITTSATRARVRRVMVTPGPSCSGPRGAVLRGREADAGPRPREPAAFLVPWREEAEADRAPGPAAGRAPGRRAPDAATGRLADRGAPGRLLLMLRGYNVLLDSPELL
ncbi:hypothetical protein GCM10009590_29980 [Brachybacterium alimentarium]